MDAGVIWPERACLIWLWNSTWIKWNLWLNEYKYKWTNKQMNEWTRTNKQMNEQMKKRTNERKKELTNERTNEQTNERTNEQTNKQTNKWTNKQINEKMNKRTNKWTNKQTNEWINKQLNKQTFKMLLYLAQRNACSPEQVDDKDSTLRLHNHKSFCCNHLISQKVCCICSTCVSWPRSFCFR